mmetsp:Transcript_67360/g.146804  ORF Transcript_67360/g.146804 Transcript_67360/m.146804 type:complete len:537 (-) Transcript_67360:362-1972(-)
MAEQFPRLMVKNSFLVLDYAVGMRRRCDSDSALLESNMKTHHDHDYLWQNNGETWSHKVPIDTEALDDANVEIMMTGLGDDNEVLVEEFALKDNAESEACSQHKASHQSKDREFMPEPEAESVPELSGTSSPELEVEEVSEVPAAQQRDVKELISENERLARENEMLRKHFASVAQLASVVEAKAKGPSVEQQGHAVTMPMSGSDLCMASTPHSGRQDAVAGTKQRGRRRVADSQIPTGAATGVHAAHAFVERSPSKTSSLASSVPISTVSGDCTASTGTGTEESQVSEGEESSVAEPESAPLPDGQSTTVMLRNLPNNYTRAMLLELFDCLGFIGLYDFVYVPIDFRSKASLGYAFVNLTSAEVAQRFWNCMSGFSSWVLPSRKVCGVSWSGPHQGYTAHVERYRNSPVMHQAVPDEYKPCVFVNGERVPFPAPTKKLRAPRVRHSSDVAAVPAASTSQQLESTPRPQEGRLKKRGGGRGPASAGKLSSTKADAEYSGAVVQGGAYWQPMMVVCMPKGSENGWHWPTPQQEMLAW